MTDDLELRDLLKFVDDNVPEHHRDSARIRTSHGFYSKTSARIESFKYDADTNTVVFYNHKGI